MSFNTREETAAFAKNAALAFPCRLTPDAQWRWRMGPTKIQRPAAWSASVFLIDGGIAPIYGNVNPRDHAARILAGLLFP
jgi:hypothetical protein